MEDVKKLVTLERSLSNIMDRMGSLEKIENGLSEILDRVSKLEGFVDSNDQQVREILAEVRLSVNQMQTLIQGSKTLRLVGLADRMETLETSVKSIETNVARLTGLIDKVGILEASITSLEREKQSLIDRGKGIKWAIGILSVTNISALGAILTEILKSS